MVKRIFSILLVVIMICGMPNSMPAAIVSADETDLVLFQDDFQDGNYTNSVWQVHSGNWSIGTDSLNPNNKVFNQTNADEGFISTGELSWTDYMVTIRFNTGGGEGYPGILARFRDINNYYYFQMQKLDKLVFAKKVNGTNTEMYFHNVSMKANTWYTLKMVLKGDSIKCYFGENAADTLIFDIRETTFTQGKIGVRNKWQTASIDDVLVVMPPSAPSGIRVEASATTAVLTWDSVPGATGYNIYRAVSENGAYTLIKSNVTVTTFTDTGLKPQTDYYYKISAAGEGGESDLSAVIACKTTYMAPNTSKLICTGKTISSVSLSWDAVNGATGYKLYRSVSGSEYEPVYSGTATSYTDSGLTKGQDYYYAVTYLKDADESEMSNVASVIPSEKGEITAVVDAKEYILKTTATHATVVTLFNDDGSTADVTADAAFESSNPSIATVNEAGIVTGVSVGNAVITVTYKNKTYFVNVSVIDKDMMLWYKFDQISGTVVKDASGNGHDGTLMGGARWINGNGIELDGVDDYVLMPNGILAGVTDVTVSTYILLDTGNVDPIWIFTFGSTTDPYSISGSKYFGLLEDASGNLRATISTNKWTGEQNANKNGPLGKGVWKNVVVTISGNTGTLYEDGVAVAQNTSMTLDPQVIEETIANYLGKPAYLQDRYLKGRYSDFRMYNRALSAKEVQELYQNLKGNQLEKDKEALSLGDISAVTENLNLPSKGEYGSIITWSSSNKDIISDTGVVKRPSYAEGNKTVVLTATISDGTNILTKEFVVTVLRKPSDLETVKMDAQLLKVYNIEDVRGNLTLPVKGQNGSTITWKSDDVSIITNTGEVTRPAHGSGDVTVKLTATISLNRVSVTKTFLAVVREMPEPQEYSAYLFTYFIGEGYSNGEQIYFALSQGNNPLAWTKMNNGNPVFTSTLGEKGLRDPFIIRSPEGDKFYMIATDLKIYGNGNWTAAQRTGSRSIMVWESTDLVHWSKQRMVEVSPELAGCTWAPEAFYDHTTGEYIVFWASKIYSDASKSDSPHQRIMYAKTRDFYTFTEAKEYYNPGYSVIDTTMIEHNGKIYRFTKDERSYNAATAPNGKMVLQQVGDSIFGEFTTIVEGIGKGSISVGEGPLVFKANGEDKWYLFIDYFSGGGYKPFVTTDLDSGQWTMLSTGSFPSPAPRHGTVLPITAKEYADLSANIPVEVQEDNVKVNGITLDQGEIQLETGAQAQLTATVTASDDNANKTVLWSSSNEAVARVSSTGLVTAVGEGTAVISATTAEGGYMATCDVVVGSKFEVNTSFNLAELKPNERLEANVTVKNNSMNSESVLVVMALYDSNEKVVGINTETKIIPSGQSDILTVELTLPDKVEGYKVKVFAWKGSNIGSSLIPITRATAID